MGWRDSRANPSNWEWVRNRKKNKAVTPGDLAKKGASTSGNPLEDAVRQELTSAGFNPDDIIVKPGKMPPARKTNAADLDDEIAAALGTPPPKKPSRKSSPGKERVPVNVIEAWNDKIDVAYSAFEATTLGSAKVYRITLNPDHKAELGEKLKALGLRGELSAREEGRSDNYLVKDDVEGETKVTYIAFTRSSLERALGITPAQDRAAG